MSAGGSLPYQLRPNKAVDRLIFSDLLRRLDAIVDFTKSKHSYFGFGGPHMADFRLLHECFPMMKMTSIEEQDHVHKRQRFNAPHTRIQYLRQTSGDFIESFQPEAPVIAWLDYVLPSARRQQIQEFQDLLMRAPENSIIKITLNANSSSLGGTGTPMEIQGARLQKFSDDFGRFFQGNEQLRIQNITAPQFPKTLIRLLNGAATEALQGRPSWRCQPLASCHYADGQTMLTLTAIVGERKKIVKFLANPRISKWPYKNLKWENPMAIDVPEFSMKERIFIDQLLPLRELNHKMIQRKLGFQFELDKDDSLRKIAHYVSFSRHFPHFGRVSV